MAVKKELSRVSLESESPEVWRCNSLARPCARKHSSMSAAENCPNRLYDGKTYSRWHKAHASAWALLFFRDRKAIKEIKEIGDIGDSGTLYRRLIFSAAKAQSIVLDDLDFDARFSIKPWKRLIGDATTIKSLERQFLDETGCSATTANAVEFARKGK